MLRALVDIVSALSDMVEHGTSSMVAPVLLGIAAVFANITTSITALQEARVLRLLVSSCCGVCNARATPDMPL